MVYSKRFQVQFQFCINSFCPFDTTPFVLEINLEGQSFCLGGWNWYWPIDFNKYLLNFPFWSNSCLLLVNAMFFSLIFLSLYYTVLLFTVFLSSFLHCFFFFHKFLFHRLIFICLFYFTLLVNNCLLISFAVFLVSMVCSLLLY